MDLFTDPPLLDPSARDAEIVELRAVPARSSAQELRLADLELDGARAQVARFQAARTAARTCPTCLVPKLDGALFDPIFARYEALLDRDPDTPGLQDAIVRLVVVDAEVWHGRPGPHGEGRALARLDAWSGAYPRADAVVAAEIRFYAIADGWCHVRQQAEPVALRLAGNPTVRRLLALEDRLAQGPAALAGFRTTLRLLEGLTASAKVACVDDAEDYRCADPRVLGDIAWVRALKERSVPVYRAALADGFEAWEAGDFFWLLVDLGRRADAEGVALAMEEAGLDETALGSWSYLTGWSAPTEAELRARTHVAALAEKLGEAGFVADLGDKAFVTHPADAVGWYQRAFGVIEAGGRYHTRTADVGRQDVLRRLAAAWRRAGDLDAAAVWFAARGLAEVWREELERPTIAETPYARER